ncbi:MAG TPA: hypothetical protein ENN44_02350 [Methanoculleus sp.]|nr:hypothetical protein [Methanoculleus sp.]
MAVQFSRSWFISMVPFADAFARMQLFRAIRSCFVSALFFAVTDVICPFCPDASAALRASSRPVSCSSIALAFDVSYPAPLTSAIRFFPHATLSLNCCILN